MSQSELYSAVEWKEGVCCLLDQTRLPAEQVTVECASYEEVVNAIKTMVVRGAPAIGVAAGYAVVLACRKCLRLAPAERGPFFEMALTEIGQARPTAVNLKWAVHRMRMRWEAGQRNLSEEMMDRLLDEAQKIHSEDIENNRRMAELGASLLSSGRDVVTYCNAGALATGGVGTALGVVKEGYRAKKIRHVYVCETRPLLQGLRLTAWELQQARVPFTVVCDNTIASVMRARNVGAVIVGADRIAANGDVANKVGTYSMAVLANHHQIPLYVIAPVSTFDELLSSGNEIPIEERSSEEVIGILGDNKPPYSMAVYSPAFDVTPNTLVSAIVCERGIIRPPSAETVHKVLHSRLSS